MKTLLSVKIKSNSPNLEEKNLVVAKSNKDIDQKIAEIAGTFWDKNRPESFQVTVVDIS